MSYDFDTGPQGGAQGPFINWHARETLDGDVAGRNFSLRDADGNRTIITDKFKKGVAFDLSTLKTGWCRSSGALGVAPEWQWNETPARFQPQPAGDDWKKGFEVRIALGKDQAATWSQSGAGAWQGLVSLMSSVKADGGDGEAAVVVFEDTQELKFKKGSTVAPVLTLKKWTDKPECLIAPAEDAAVAEDDTADAFDDDEF